MLLNWFGIDLLNLYKRQCTKFSNEEVEIMVICAFMLKKGDAELSSPANLKILTTVWHFLFLRSFGVSAL